MRLVSIFILILFFHKISFSQDSTLIGRFSVGLLGAVGKTNIAEEDLSKGYNLQLKYFPKSNVAFVLSHTGLYSGVNRLGVVHPATQRSIAFGGEYHVPFGKISPYLGLEVGVNFTHTNSSLTQSPFNQYFINNLATYLFKPKIGLQYAVNNNIRANFEADYYWSFHSESEILNPLNSDTGPIFFGRKVYLLSIGISYLFNE